MSDIFRIVFIVAIVLLIWRVLVWQRTKAIHTYRRMTQAAYRYDLIYKENTTARNLAGALTPARARRECQAKRRADRARQRYESTYRTPRKKARAGR